MKETLVGRGGRYDLIPCGAATRSSAEGFQAFQNHSADEPSYARLGRRVIIFATKPKF